MHAGTLAAKGGAQKLAESLVLALVSGLESNSVEIKADNLTGTGKCNQLD